MSTSPTTREVLIYAVAKFTAAASLLRGVTRISLLGSLTTPKPNPKDADVLVSIERNADIAELAALGRKLKGRAQHFNLGADIFLASSDGEYLGRTCSYRECHPRVSCRGSSCGSGKHLCDDLRVVTLPLSLIAEPPVELWPQRLARCELPADTARLLSESHGFRAAQLGAAASGD